MRYKLWIDNFGSPKQLFKADEIKPLSKEGLVLKASVKILKAEYPRFQTRTATIQEIVEDE